MRKWSKHVVYETYVEQHCGYAVSRPQALERAFLLFLQ